MSANRSYDASIDGFRTRCILSVPVAGSDGAVVCVLQVMCMACSNTYVPCVYAHVCIARTHARSAGSVVLCVLQLRNKMKPGMVKKDATTDSIFHLDDVEFLQVRSPAFPSLL